MPRVRLIWIFQTEPLIQTALRLYAWTHLRRSRAPPLSVMTPAALPLSLRVLACDYGLTWLGRDQVTETIPMHDVDTTHDRQQMHHIHRLQQYICDLFIFVSTNDYFYIFIKPSFISSLYNICQAYELHRWMSQCTDELTDSFKTAARILPCPSCCVVLYYFKQYSRQSIKVWK